MKFRDLPGLYSRKDDEAIIDVASASAGVRILGAQSSGRQVEDTQTHSRAVGDGFRVYWNGIRMFDALKRIGRMPRFVDQLAAKAVDARKHAGVIAVDSVALALNQSGDCLPDWR